MAAYASTVTLLDRKPTPIGNGLSMLRGTVDVTNYNSTRVAITDITKYFRDTDGPHVMLGGASDNGYMVAWETSSVKAWDHLDTGVGEVADDTDIGAVTFVATGVSAL